jgi:cytochrome c2
MVKSILAAAALIAFASLPAFAQDPKLVSKGRDLTVKNHCAMCHQLAGKGGKIGKPLDGVTARLDEAAIRRILADPQKELPDGKVKMPKVAWAAGDIDAVVAYLQTLK